MARTKGGKGSDELDEYKSKVEEVLLRYSSKRVGDATVYFIDAAGDAQLRSLQDHYDRRDTDKFSKRVKTEFSKVLKIVNPGKPATQYSTGIRGKHRQITDHEVIFDEKFLDTEFAIWKNKYKKLMTEEAILHNYDDEAMRVLNDQINTDILKAEGELQYLKDNQDKVVVKIAGVLHQKSYPYIQFPSENEKGDRITLTEHLSILAPNAFYYTPALYRSDMTINTFVKLAKNPFGDVFYMMREEEDGK
ncbi:MAG: hypothetical protein PHT07_10785 [Paludibacter sp.]|nr:hypothetical protein [Paludibacter sp.]